MSDSFLRNHLNITLLPLSRHSSSQHVCDSCFMSFIIMSQNKFIKNRPLTALKVTRKNNLEIIRLRFLSLSLYKWGDIPLKIKRSTKLNLSRELCFYKNISCMELRLSIWINYMAFESYQYLMKYKENINCD